MVDWKVSTQQEDYLSSIKFMDNRVNQIIANKAPELIWFLQYPPLYTAGSSAKENELTDVNFPVYQTGRGGKFTYHGPGQLIVYLMLNLQARNAADIKLYVYNLEQIIIDFLSEFGINGIRINDKVGVWINVDDQYKKIGAIGIRVKRWVTFHGISININPDLSHYNGIIPCGVTEYGITSLQNLNITTNTTEAIHHLQTPIQKILLNKEF